jgi:hypothetical protein
MRKIKVNPGDILLEMLGESEGARYIITGKRPYINNIGHTYAMYESIILYVTGEWANMKKPGDRWIIDELNFEDNAGAFSYEILFKSPLRWKD